MSPSVRNHGGLHPTENPGWQHRLRWALLRQEADALLKSARPPGGGRRRPHP